MTTPIPDGTPADWHRDPTDPTLERFWDGTTWTDQVRPAPEPVALPASPEVVTTNTLSIVAMVLGLVGFLFSPLLLGLPAVVVAGFAGRKGEPLARRAMVVAGVALVLGVVSGLVVRALG